MYCAGATTRVAEVLLDLEIDPHRWRYFICTRRSSTGYYSPAAAPQWRRRAASLMVGTEAASGAAGTRISVAAGVSFAARGGIGLRAAAAVGLPPHPAPRGVAILWRCQIPLTVELGGLIGSLLALEG